MMLRPLVLIIENASCRDATLWHLPPSQEQSNHQTSQSSMLQDESIATLIDTISCREGQIRQLATIFCQPNFLSPSTTVVHGVKSTGKSLTISSVLESCNNNTRHAIVQSADWVDSRELLEAIISAVANIISKEENKEEDVDIDIDGRCESISSFVVQLQLLLEGKGNTILVVDGIDRQREPWLTLLPAIARLGEVVSLEFTTP